MNDFWPDDCCSHNSCRIQQFICPATIKCELSASGFDRLMIKIKTPRGKLTLLSLAWREDIDFEKRLINIRAINAKSNIPRSIPMTRRVHDRLKELYNQTGNDSSGLVFGGLRDVKRSFGTACGIKEIA